MAQERLTVGVVDRSILLGFTAGVLDRLGLIGKGRIKGRIEA